MLGVGDGYPVELVMLLVGDGILMLSVCGDEIASCILSDCSMLFAAAASKIEKMKIINTCVM